MWGPLRVTHFALAYQQGSWATSAVASHVDRRHYVVEWHVLPPLRPRGGWGRIILESDSLHAIRAHAGSGAGCSAGAGGAGISWGLHAAAHVDSALAGACVAVLNQAQDLTPCFPPGHDVRGHTAWGMQAWHCGVRSLSADLLWGVKSARHTLHVHTCASGGVVGACLLTW